MELGLEPIYMELSGGQFLPPVQTLVATFIFAKGENAKSSPILDLPITNLPIGWFFAFISDQNKVMKHIVPGLITPALLI